jgi:hypothetical protein
MGPKEDRIAMWEKLGFLEPDNERINIATLYEGKASYSLIEEPIKNFNYLLIRRR